MSDRILGARKERGEVGRRRRKRLAVTRHRRWKTDRATYMRVVWLERIFAGIKFTTDKCVERMHTFGQSRERNRA